MYLPRHFQVAERAALYQLIDHYPLATLVVCDANGPIVNHIPLLLDLSQADKPRLVGHIARGNPLWKTPLNPADAIAVFQGPQTYVSPGFYPTKTQDGKVVPTYNYEVVHAKGPLSFFDDADQLLDVVTRLTNKHEAAEPRAWQVSDAPNDYIQKMLRAIVGIEITNLDLVGKFKISQNQPLDNRKGVVRGLDARGRPLDQAMARHINDLPE